MVIVLAVEAKSAGEGQETGRDQALGRPPGRSITRGQAGVGVGVGPRFGKIARDLIAKELVPGLVAVEHFNHPIAVPPGEGDGVIGRFARCVGVADHIEPLPAPVFPVSGRGQQALDDPDPGGGGRIGQKFNHQFATGREPRQIKCQSAEPHVRRGCGAGGEAPLRHALVKIVVNPGPGLVAAWVAERGGRAVAGPVGFERPVRLARQRAALLGPVESFANPAGKVGDLIGPQGLVPIGGHGGDVGLAGDRRKQETLGRFLQIDRGARVAPLEEPGTGIETEATTRPGGPMTADARADQNRTDTGLEKIFRLIGLQGVKGRTPGMQADQRREQNRALADHGFASFCGVERRRRAIPSILTGREVWPK